MKKSHVVDYEILGNDLQLVEIELDPLEAVVGEAGSMNYMDGEIQMKTIFGDGSQEEQSVLNKFLKAGKRLLTGESMFMTVFTNHGDGKKRIAFAAPYPGKIIPLNLSEYDEEIICQKDSFLCSAKGVSIGIAINKKIGVGLFGGEGFIMQKLEGDGMVFVHAGGTVVEKSLKDNEVLKVDTGCIVAFTKTVSFDIEMVKGVKSVLFSGEGLYFATLKGPGIVWIQSLPFNRLAARLMATTGGLVRKEEGFAIRSIGDAYDD